MAEMTKAVKAADEYRDMMNHGKTKIMAPDFSCAVYVFLDSRGRACATGYKGRAKKPTLNYYYSSVEARDKSVENWMNSVIEYSNQKIKSEPRQLQIDDVLSASWGYDQTNVDFYKVVKLVGSASVEVVEIGREYESTGDMAGRVIPDVEEIIGEPIRRRVCKHNGKRVRINSVVSASLMEPEIIAGCKIYKSMYCSSYA